MKQASLEAINLFHQRILVHQEGDEYAIKQPDNTYKTYFVLEDGTSVESDIYKIKSK